MDLNPNSTAEEASAVAIHKAQSAQQAIEMARELQMQRAVEETARKTKEALLEGLQEVFGASDSENPQQMRILVRRIPIICTSIDQMHSDITDIKDNLKWGVRLVLGAVILAIVALVIKR